MRGSSSVNHLASRDGKTLKRGTRGQTGHRTKVTHEECGRSTKPEVDGVGFETQLCYDEGFSDENGYMWLPSSGRPPCSQSSIGRQSSDTSEIDLSDGLLYHQFSGKSSWTFFDVDQKNLVSDTFNASATGGASLLLSDRTRGCGAEFGGRCSSSEDSSAVVQDTVSVWLPLFDLEGEEEPKRDADDLHVCDQGFLRPSCHRRTNLQAKSSSFSCRQDFDQVSSESSNHVPNLSQEDLLDVKHLPEDSDADEPLFWPFDQKSYWSTDLEWSYLDISPFGSFLNIGRPTGSHPSKLFQFRLDHRYNSSLHRRNFHQRCRGRIPFSSTSSKPHLAVHKSTDPSSRIPNGIGTPSERCRSTRLPPSTATRSLSKKGGGEDLHRSNPLANKRVVVHQERSLDEYLLEFEADDFHIYLTGEIPIEALLGLDEFDGHEGIGRVTAG